MRDEGSIVRRAGGEGRHGSLSRARTTERTARVFPQENRTKMPLSKVALMCLESSALMKSDILFLKGKSRYMRRQRVRRSFTERPSQFPVHYERLRQNPDEFFQNLNLSVEIFDYILEHVRADLELAKNSNYKTPEEKLFLTLKYLTGSMSIKQLAKNHCADPKAILNIIIKTLLDISTKLSPIHLRAPTPGEVNSLAIEFYNKWKFPNCVGAIGGKYIRILDPSTGTIKKNILNAVVDANFRFLAAYFERKRSAEESFVKNMFNISGMQCLPGTEVMLPLFVIGNEAYPLKPNLMKPYPRKTSFMCSNKDKFNDKLKQARVPVDCAFEILTEKWKIFTTPFTVGMPETKLISKVTCLLHNIIKDREGDRDPHFSRFGQVDHGCIYLHLVTHKSRKNNRSSSVAVAIRDQLLHYIQHNP